MVKIIKVNQWFVGDDGESTPHTIVEFNGEKWAVEDLSWDSPGEIDYKELIETDKAFKIKW